MRRVFIVLGLAGVVAGTVAGTAYYVRLSRIHDLIAQLAKTDGKGTSWVDREVVSKLAAEGRPGVEPLSKLAATDDYGAHAYATRSGAVQALGEIGAAAKSAVPVLRSLLGELQFFGYQSGREDDIIVALGKIGPEAREAVPDLALRAWAFVLNTRTSERALDALMAIDPDTARSIERRLDWDPKFFGSPVIRLVEPNAESAERARVVFKWNIDGRAEGVRYCSTVVTDKIPLGAKTSNPFRGYHKLFPAGDATSLGVELFHWTQFGIGERIEWGVVLTACLDNNSRCEDRYPPCAGPSSIGIGETRTFRIIE
jgi:hypothetical protein